MCALIQGVFVCGGVEFALDWFGGSTGKGFGMDCSCNSATTD